MSDNALIIFAKNPVLGKVKTRLAKTEGDEQALEIYEKLLAFTREQVQQVKATVIVYYSDQIESNDDWVEVEKKVQVSGDLGEKMSEALEAELVNYKKVCIIGTDCAQLEAEIINRAFSELDDTDFVLGPANDGGYYLLGMKSFHTELFDDMKWSTSKVLRETLNRIKSMNKSVSLLPELVDIDTIQDWQLVMDNFK